MNKQNEIWDRRAMLAIRVALFAAFPFLFECLAYLVSVTACVFLLPFLFPLAAYTHDSKVDKQTVFGEQFFLLNVAYCVLVGFLAMLITRKSPPWGAVRRYLLVATIATVATHITMRLAGYTISYGSL